MIKFGTGGWRAIIGDDFTRENVQLVANGILEYAKETNKTDKPIIIGYDRRFLSDLKDALTRWNDSPYQSCKNALELMGKNEADIVFVDCREPEEIKRFVEDYDALTVLVQRGEVVLYGNHADDNVENYQYDVIIDNSRGLDELMQEATIFVETFVEDSD